MQESGESTRVFECRKVYLAILVVRNKQEINGEEGGTYAVQHAVLLTRLPEIDGTLPDKVVERVLCTTGERFNLAKFHPNVLCLDALGTQANLDGLNGSWLVTKLGKAESITDPFDGRLGSVRCAWGNTRITYAEKLSDRRE